MTSLILAGGVNQQESDGRGEGWSAKVTKSYGIFSPRRRRNRKRTKITITQGRNRQRY